MKTIRLIFIALVALTQYSCGGGPPGEEKDDRTVFRYNESAGITSLDPAFARNLENIWAINQLFNGLVQMDDNFEVQPAIAKSWDISEDGKEYTFYLRDDVYFHDHEAFKGGKGRRVVASDFVSSFFRIMDEKVASPGSWIFNNIAKTDKSNYTGFVAENDTTLKIYLRNPFPPFLGLLTMQYCSVVPPEVVEHLGDDFRNNPIGTGPFKFKVWNEGSKLIFVKNENYFETDEDGKKLPYLDAVSISFIKDEQVAYFEFLKGGVDFMSGLDGSYKDQILTNSGELKEEFKEDVNMITHPYLNTEYLGFLVDEDLEIVQNSPVRHKKVRQAINYAFDRKQMITYLRNNIGTPANSGFIPKGMPSFDEMNVKGYSHNPDKARELLAEAGFPNGEGMETITLHTTAQYLDLCEFIQHQIEEIGIPIEIELNTEATHREMVARSGITFFRKSWIADYPDAENYLALFYSYNFSPGGPNYTHFKNKEYDHLYEKALKEVDDSTRYEYYKQMDQIIIEEAPVVPLYYDQVVRFVRKDVENLGINPMNLLILKKVKKTGKVEKDEPGEES